MKETQPHLQDQVKIEVPAQHQKKLQLLSRKHFKKGHTLFEFNFKENTIKKLVFEEDKLVSFDGKKQKHKKVVIKENCVYIPALNVKNAIRHIHNKIASNINPKII